jgi:hypothetical protein
MNGYRPATLTHARAPMNLERVSDTEKVKAKLWRASYNPLVMIS